MIDMVTQNETVVICYGYDNLAIIYWQFFKLPGFGLRIWTTRIAFIFQTVRSIHLKYFACVFVGVFW